MFSSTLNTTHFHFNFNINVNCNGQLMETAVVDSPALTVCKSILSYSSDHKFHTPYIICTILIILTKQEKTVIIKIAFSKPTISAPTCRGKREPPQRKRGGSGAC